MASSSLRRVSRTSKNTPGSPPKTDTSVVRIHWPQGKSEFVYVKKKDVHDFVSREAPWWNYALLNRERWRGTEVLSVAQQSRALEVWSQLFPNTFSRDQEEKLPLVMEVSINAAEPVDTSPYVSLPWEFVINAVVRSHYPWEGRDNHRVPVIRHLVQDTLNTTTRKVPALGPDHKKWKVLVVLSAPGFIGRIYQLNSEREKLYKRLGIEAKKPDLDTDGDAVDTDRFKTLWTPSFSEVKNAISEFKPDIVHFAGCDTHQACAEPESGIYSDRVREVMYRQLGFLGEEGDPQPAEEVVEEDGYAMKRDGTEYVNGDEARIECVPYKKLPQLFADHQPALVCWNLYHSANRLAATTVAIGGVGASIGFQDYIDDEIAEEFFDEFYGGLLENRGQIAQAHVRGLNALWRLPD